MKKTYLRELLENKKKSYNLQLTMEKIKKTKVGADNYSYIFEEEIDKDISKILSNQRYANSILKKLMED